MNNYNNSRSEKQKIKYSKPAKYTTYPIQVFIPQCEVCEKNRSDFYCTECKVHYCQNCESEVHTSFWKKKHKEFIFQEPYVPRIKLSLFCKDENKLICTGCYDTCRTDNHAILSLNGYSNEISEKIKIILNTIQKEEIRNNETIQKSLENQKKIKQEIKELYDEIKINSNLLIEKIQTSKIKYLNLLKNIEMITNKKFDKILKKNMVKQKMINENKNQIKNLKKMKKDENYIKLIQESKEMIERQIQKEEILKQRQVQIETKRQREMERLSQRKMKQKIERGKKRRKKIQLEREKDQFDPRMNRKNLIKLKNGNKTACNALYGMGICGTICGKKIYSSGKHEIKIRIDKFPNPKNQINFITLGVVKTEDRGKLIKKWGNRKTYFFVGDWSCFEERMRSYKGKRLDGNQIQKERCPKKIKLKEYDFFTIFLDMDKKIISFKINEINLGGWRNLPKRVCFFADLFPIKGLEKNQISIL
ncbi:hypothetical protein M0813_13779 [Anaeramoeba flamelloides]|uniref:B box-type domain-containing protein n=1 Tax=Anaeramoeba flamelloides TaxID=1746091 RepID=A0ABQ8Z7Q1_9EUKA|nr:hypothetical protein M0813_13779 [Anaeramoeba flamelloides]